jgi:hypothetical protein
MELEDKPFWRDAPFLPEALEWVYRAFWDLSGSRKTSGGGIGSIPFEAADKFAERFGVEDFEEFWTLIRAMDGVFISHFNERSKVK